jgi:hypothetical protein
MLKSKASPVWITPGQSCSEAGMSLSLKERGNDSGAEFKKSKFLKIID